ncbi:hypothetical protein ID11_20245 (plasmid) [Pantoea vagans]|nr:hypothetical protein ID11_20245 [Pantoea vagans]
MWLNICVHTAGFYAWSIMPAVTFYLIGKRTSVVVLQQKALPSAKSLIDQQKACQLPPLIRCF